MHILLLHERKYKSLLFDWRVQARVYILISRQLWVETADHMYRRECLPSLTARRETEILGVSCFKTDAFSNLIPGDIPLRTKVNQSACEHCFFKCPLPCAFDTYLIDIIHPRSSATYSLQVRHSSASLRRTDLISLWWSQFGSVVEHEGYVASVLPLPRRGNSSAERWQGERIRYCQKFAPLINLLVRLAIYLHIRFSAAGIHG